MEVSVASSSQGSSGRKTSLGSVSEAEGGGEGDPTFLLDPRARTADLYHVRLILSA